MTAYCSRRCQQLDYTKHQPLCARLEKMYASNIEEETKKNTDYRRVIWTGQLQLVLMSLNPKQEIGMEKHDEDQFFKIVAGSAILVGDDKTYELKDEWAGIVPGRSNHNFIAGDQGAKLYTIYSPAHHPRDTLQKTKEEEKH